MVFGVSMSSDANRRLVSQTWDTIVANFGMRMEADYVEDEKIVRHRDKQEIEDFHMASQTLEIAEMDLGYLPTEMEYLYCQLDEIEGKIIFFYEYNENILQIIMMKKNLEGVSYYTLDDDTELRAVYTNNQEIEVKLGAMKVNEEDEMYIAQICYQEGNYIVSGVIPVEEMEQIVKNIYFL